eukprot:6008646-Pyramimonas_sp.AAC.1
MVRPLFAGAEVAGHHGAKYFQICVALGTPGLGAPAPAAVQDALNAPSEKGGGPMRRFTLRRTLPARTIIPERASGARRRCDALRGRAVWGR